MHLTSRLLLTALLAAAAFACNDTDSPNDSSSTAGGAGAPTVAGASGSVGITSGGAGGGGAGATNTAGASGGGAAGSGSGGESAGAGGVSGGSGGTSAGSAGSAGSGGARTVDHDAHGVIVVLGSSTAAGTGPSKPENTWVERYRAYLGKEFKNFELINLAVGGYTTYQMQASDYVPPAGRPKPVPEHNITLALTHNPNAILINMPTNDAAGNIPLSEQMANYARVTDLATSHGATCWVTTSQPRNFADAAQRMSLMATRDAVKAKYGDHTLDFWTQFAETDGTIKAAFNSGDGVHMNDAAHALLAEQVIDAKVPETVLTK